MFSEFEVTKDETSCHLSCACLVSNIDDEVFWKSEMYLLVTCHLFYEFENRCRCRIFTFSLVFAQKIKDNKYFDYGAQYFSKVLPVQRFQGEVYLKQDL